MFTDMNERKFDQLYEDRYIETEIMRLRTFRDFDFCLIEKNRLGFFQR